MSKLTGAEVAASSNLTGSQTMGGDWQLEVVTGKIEAGLAFQPLVGETYNTVLHAGHDHDEEVQDHSEHDEKEHTAFLDLVPHSMATHVAVKNGSWSSSKTWKNGKVPGNEANVLIPEGRSVTYNVNSDARLNTLRVDGMLNFAQGQNTKMLIDTFTVAPEGKLSIGTEDNPIQADRTARIIFTSDSPIDRAKDPKQFGQGLITHGDVRIYGANKLDYVALKNDALKGDNELVLNLPNGASVPAGWRVGDQLVLGGTSYSAKGSDEDNSRFQDEVLTITAVNGNRIRFTNNNITSGDNSVLRFDHERPEGFEDEGLKLYVANTTRNVSFETENADRASLQQRGHVMFMHNPDVQVHNAGFYNLGRTDKSKPIDDPGQNVNGSSGSGTNPRGRYSLHFHKIVTEDINSTPASATGNAVVGSPGWGIVHHASYAVLEDNVVFDVVGSGIVAEAGNEIGAWRNNITIKTTGDGDSDTDLRVDPIRPDRVPLFDFGYQGEGYWVQGAAQVEMIDNIAISAAGGGIDIFGKADELDHYREAPTFPVAYLPSKLQFLAQKGESGIDVANLPLRRLSGFESYNSIDGIIFWQHMGNNDGQLGFNTPDPDPAHNARALVDDFKLWNIVRRGVHLQYGTQIDLVDGLILGNTSRPNPFSVGISHNEFAQNHLYKNLRIEGFEEGMRVPREGGNDESVSFLGSRLENSYLANNTYNLSEQFSRQTSAGSYVFPDYFEIVNTTFSVPGDNKAPTAKFNYQADGD